MAAAIAPALSPAVVTKVFVDDSFGDFAGGELKTATVKFDGTVVAPPSRSTIGTFDAEIVWDFVREDGKLYAVTGHDGRLFVLDEKKGEPELIHEFDDPGLYSIAVDRKGSLFVGASPSGVIWRLRDRKTPEIFSETGARFIWKMLPQRDGSLVVATGSDGLVMKVDDSGTTSTLATLPKVKNVLDLVEDGDGGFIAGTQERGMAAHITKGGKVRVIVDSEQDEVRRVLRREDDTVYLAVNGRRSPGDKFLKPGGNAGDGKPRDAAFILEARPDGFVYEFFTSPQTPIHDMAFDQEGNIIVSAGTSGILYSVNARGERDLLAKFDEEVISRLITGAKGEVLAGTGATATIQRMNLAERVEGSFLSRVFGAPAVASWGRLYLSGSGTGVSLRTRSGNTDAPDDTWSDWSTELKFTDGSAAIASNPARFLQYEAKLPAPGKNNNPALDIVKVYYAEANQPPIITSISTEAMLPRGMKKEEAKGMPMAASASGPVIVNPNMNSQMTEIRWAAADPNADELRYTVEFAPLGSERWVIIVEDHNTGTYPWNTAGVGDGTYRIRVTASDAPGNPAGSERTAQLVSSHIIVDNTPPVIAEIATTRDGKKGVMVSFTATDATSPLASAAWRADLGLWNALIPADRIFDHRTESFAFTVVDKDAEEGTVITVLLTDVGGNTAMRSVTLGK